MTRTPEPTIHQVGQMVIRARFRMVGCLKISRYDMGPLLFEINLLLDLVALHLGNVVHLVAGAGVQLPEDLQGFLVAALVRPATAIYVSSTA
jgi:hypothetical protein